MKKDEKQLKVALYLRVSTDDQKDGYGINLQEDSIRALVKSKGQLSDGKDRYVVSEKHIYKDEGISGTTAKNDRPEFSRLIEDLENSEKKPFDIVAVYKIDRFARRLKVLLDVVDYFDEKEVAFISANESIDTSTPFGNAILGIMGVIAELEIETTKMRTQGGRKAAVRRGVFMGSAAPFGFNKSPDKKLIVLEEEAKVVRLIYDLFVEQNYTSQQIADYLRQNKYLAPDDSAVYYKKRAGKVKKKNGPFFWRAEKVKRILSDEVYIGKYYYGKYIKSTKQPKDVWKLSPHQHQSIVDDHKFKLTQHLLEEKGQFKLEPEKTKTTKSYLLSGLIKCSTCRNTGLLVDLPSWVGDRKKLKSGKYSYYYKCGNINARKTSYPCVVLPLPARKFEEYIVNYVKQLLEKPEAVFDYKQNLNSNKLELNRLRTRRDDLRKLKNSGEMMIDRIKEQHELGLIETDEMVKKLEVTNEKLKAYKEELEVIDLQIGKKANVEAYEKAFEIFAKAYEGHLEESFEDRDSLFEILHILIDGIVIHARKPKLGEKIPGRKKELKTEAVADYKPSVSRISEAVELPETGEEIDSPQRIPFEIDIYLKLPQVILAQLARKHILNEDILKEFGVNSANL